MKTLRDILFDGLNHCYDIAQAAKDAGHTVEGLRQRMPTTSIINRENGRREVNFTTLHSFMIDGVPV